MSAPLAGLTVIEVSSTLPGATATQFLADAGADVIIVEPPGGTPARRSAGWPARARGKRSAVLDLDALDGRARLDALIERADVLVTTLSPAANRRFGLTPGALTALNPALVSATISGWGPDGPWSDLPGYEGLVMAKLGTFHAKRRMGTRPGPAFVSVPYASWGAAHGAVQGVLAALLERESTGRGQHVRTDLVRGLTTLDCWNWYTELVGLRWPGAYEVVDSFDASGEPASPLPYTLLVVPTQDGHWLQFAQTAPRLFRAMLRELDLGHLIDDPDWAGLPVLETQAQRSTLWAVMLERASRRTLAQWEHIFATEGMIAAERFRGGHEVLDHPQLRVDGRVVVAEDPYLGPVRQPSTLVHVDGAPLRPPGRAPQPGEGDPPEASPFPAGSDAAPCTPLAGVTVLEFGSMFAAPYGATLLADLGARVIKVETLAGDEIRRLLPFPEAGGAKVTQGKESISVDLTTAEGLRIVHELVGQADVVLQSFRGDTADRLGLGADVLRAIRPDLVYVNAPGYGTRGPWSARPAYAPSIGAAGGFALIDAPGAAGGTGTLAEIKRSALRLNQATSVAVVNADGVAAVAVASTMLLGLLARRRGRALGEITTTMLATASHVVTDHVVDYPGRPAGPRVDETLSGLSALYRLYPAAEGWVFLAAPTDRDWERLATALDLADDERFRTAPLRVQHDGALAARLGDVFETRTAEEWEKRLGADRIGCVEVTEVMPEQLLQADPALSATYGATAHHPVFDEHLRLGPLVTFSRSSTVTRGGCLAGEHTDAILAGLGYDDAHVTDLRSRGVVS